MEQNFSTVSERAKNVSFTDPQKFTRSQKFISKFRRKFKEGCQFYNPDTTLMSKEEYLKADLRVLIFFNAPYSVKGSSQTVGALNSFVKEICNVSRTAEQNAIIEPQHSKKVAPEPHARGPLNVFVDFCYFPEASDLKLYDRYNMPYAIGNATHLDASYYDIVGFSIAILHEVCTTPLVISTFDRCDYQIPLTWSERKDTPFGQYPMIYAGGITASCGEIMFGELGDGRTAFVDGLYLGSCEKMDIMFERAIEAKEYNEQVRCNGPAVYGPYNELMYQNSIMSLQDYYNALFDLPWFYQPQAYKVVYDDRNLIVENTKINPHAQDFVEPYYPTKIHEDYLGIAMSVINANGDSTGRCESQVSEGVVAAGSLLRTSKGLIPVEDFCKHPNDYSDKNYPEVEQLEGIQSVEKTWIQGVKKVRKFNLQYGFELATSPDHPIETYDSEGNKVFKQAQELKVGDKVFIKSSCDFVPSLNKQLDDDDDRYWGSKFFGKSFWNKMERAPQEFVSVEELTNSIMWGCRKDIQMLIMDEIYSDIVGIPDELITTQITEESESTLRQWVIDNKDSFHDKALKYFTYFDEETNETEVNCDLDGFESMEDVYGYVDSITDLIVKYNGGYYECNSEEDAAYNQQYFLCYGYVFGREGNKLWYEGYGLTELEIVSIVDDLECDTYDITVPVNEKYLANGVSVHNCSAAGVCSFKVTGDTRIWTDQGIKKIRELEGKQVSTASFISESNKGIQRQSDSNVYVVESEAGHQLRCDKHHKFMVIENGVLVEREAIDLRPGDYFFRKTAFDKSFKDYCPYQGGLLYELIAEYLATSYGCLVPEELFISPYSVRKAYVKKALTFRVLSPNKEELQDLLVLGASCGYNLEVTEREEGYGVSESNVTYDIKLSEDLQYYVDGKVAVVDRIYSVTETDEESDMYDVMETDSNLCAYGTFITHNCHEGAFTNGWTEKDFERNIYEARQAKKFAAASRYSPFSFNTNYITNWKGYLYEMMKLFTKISIHNQRMEELGKDVDAIRMAKYMGANHLACLDKDTLITTKRGLIPIKDVVVGDEVLSVDYEITKRGGKQNHHDVWTKVVAVKNQGVKPLYRVTLSSGNYVIATEDHLFMTCSDFNHRKGYTDTQVKDLLKHKYKYVLLPESVNGNTQTSVNGIELTEGIAEFMGWLVGDGYVTENCTRFCFGEKDEEFYLVVKNFLDSNDISYHQDDAMGKFGPTKRININASWFKTLVKVFGIAGTSVNKPYPKVVLSLAPNLQYAFLRGYFSADGSIKFGKENNRTTCCIHCSSISPDILRGLTLTLNSLGIQTTQTEFKENTGGFENQNLISELYIVKPESYRRFIKNIGFGLEYKRNLMRCDSDKGTYYWNSVESVTYEKDDECWDIQVEGKPYFYANNVLVHNCPLEGISPVIQNNILNKCLSEESITNIMEYAIHGKTSEIKVGGILTSFEREEDWKWFFDFSDRMQAKAAAEGGNLKFRMNFTPLVCYPLTVCEYFPRGSAKKSFFEERWFTPEFVQEFKSRGIRTKIHGSRGSNFTEHCLVDLGRYLTPWLYKYIIQEHVPIYSLRSLCYPESMVYLKSIINQDWYFRERHPDHYISPSHRIHLQLRGSYIARARKIISLYQQGRIYDMEPDTRCLKTYEGAKTKCYSSCMSSDPYKDYYDVTLDKDLNLHGEYREIKGCERCTTKEMKLGRLNREIKSTKNSDDILAYPKPRPVLRLRFVLQRHKPYDIINPRATAHTFMAKILTLAPEELTDYFHMVENHSNYWSALPKTPYYFSGIQIVDCLFLNRKAFDIVKSIIPEANKVLKSTTILSVHEEFIDDRIKVDDYNVFKFTTTLPADAFHSASLTYKGEIKVEHEDQIVMVKDKELKAPQFISKGGIITGIVVLPCRYNPSLYLSAFLNQQNVSVPAVNETTEFENLMVVRTGSNVCRQCSNEPGFISLATGKELPFGPNCLAKALIRKLK